MDAVDKARELGAEHGRGAAEECFAGKHEVGLVPIGRPEPDLNEHTSAVRNQLGKIWESYVDLNYQADWDDMEHAYEAAFTAAVEATIRAKCSEVSA